MALKVLVLIQIVCEAPSSRYPWGSRSRLSLPYICSARPSCRRLLWQEARFAFSFAEVSAGNSSAARIAMMAITTSSSISVKAARAPEHWRTPKPGGRTCGPWSGRSAAASIPCQRGPPQVLYRGDTSDFIILRALSSDRKSTRLNSSHGYISYAVFCLKKKKEYSDNEMLAYQQKESTARVAAIMENTNLSKQQQVCEIMRQMPTQSQTAGQNCTNDPIT